MRATGGWVFIAVFGAVYDCWAMWYGHETLSGAFWRGMANPKARIPLAIGTGMLVKHLVAPGVLPKTDPLLGFGRKIRELQ